MSLQNPTSICPYLWSHFMSKLLLWSFEISDSQTSLNLGWVTDCHTIREYLWMRPFCFWAYPAALELSIENRDMQYVGILSRTLLMKVSLPLLIKRYCIFHDNSILDSIRFQTCPPRDRPRYVVGKDPVLQLSMPTNSSRFTTWLTKDITLLSMLIWWPEITLKL